MDSPPIVFGLFEGTDLFADWWEDEQERLARERRDIEGLREATAEGRYDEAARLVNPSLFMRPTSPEVAQIVERLLRWAESSSDWATVGRLACCVLLHFDPTDLRALRVGMWAAVRLGREEHERASADLERTEVAAQHDRFSEMLEYDCDRLQEWLHKVDECAEERLESFVSHLSRMDGEGRGEEFLADLYLRKGEVYAAYDVAYRRSWGDHGEVWVPQVLMAGFEYALRSANFQVALEGLSRALSEGIEDRLADEACRRLFAACSEANRWEYAAEAAAFLFRFDEPAAESAFQVMLNQRAPAPLAAARALVSIGKANSAALGLLRLELLDSWREGKAQRSDAELVLSVAPDDPRALQALLYDDIRSGSVKPEALENRARQVSAALGEGEGERTILLAGLASRRWEQAAEAGANLLRVLPADEEGRSQVRGIMRACRAAGRSTATLIAAVSLITTAGGEPEALEVLQGLLRSWTGSGHIKPACEAALAILEYNPEDSAVADAIPVWIGGLAKQVGGRSAVGAIASVIGKQEVADKATLLRTIVMQVLDLGSFWDLDAAVYALSKASLRDEATLGELRREIELRDPTDFSYAYLVRSALSLAPGDEEVLRLLRGRMNDESDLTGGVAVACLFLTISPGDQQACRVLEDSLANEGKLGPQEMGKVAKALLSAIPDHPSALALLQLPQVKPYGKRRGLSELF